LKRLKGEHMVYPRTFSHIGISVPNVEEALKFYTEVMG
jgi:catechol-2,3-dioxygenase